MAPNHSDTIQQRATKFSDLLSELQVIWDEVGEEKVERDKIIMEIEQECMEVYRRKIEQAKQSREQVRKSIAVAEAERASIFSTMGEQPIHTMRQAANLKDDLSTILSQVEDLRKRQTLQNDKVDAGAGMEDDDDNDNHYNYNGDNQTSNEGAPTSKAARTPNTKAAETPSRSSRRLLDAKEKKKAEELAEKRKRQAKEKKKAEELEKTQLPITIYAKVRLETVGMNFYTFSCIEEPKNNWKVMTVMTTEPSDLLENSNMYAGIM